MLRLLARLGVAAATMFVLTAVQTGPAHAADATGCRVAPGHVFTFAEYCTNSAPASTYTVAFHAPFANGAWSITGPYSSVYTGCGATDEYCTVTVRGPGGSREIQGSKAGVFVGSASIEPWCGQYLC
jgi:hypothetical protein